MEETEYMKQFTDTDFQYSAAQFDVDYLEGISSEANSDPNSLTRESLFVKFDPLVGKQVLDSKTTNTSNRLKICEEHSAISDELPKVKAVQSLSNDLLMMDTPPKKEQPSNSSVGNVNGQPPVGGLRTSPVHLDLQLSESDLISMAQSAMKKMYTEDEVAEMIKSVKKEEIDCAQKKYGPQIAALEKELVELEHKPGQLYNECMFMGSIQSSQENLLQKEVDKWKLLITEHELVETLIVHCHEKLKEKFLSLAEHRDTILKSETFKVRSFEELQQRFLKLQDINRKLYKNQCSLSTLKTKNKEVLSNLEKVGLEYLIKQDELNLSHESLQKELSSKIAVERAQARTIELQVKSMERDLQQNEQEKQQLTQIAEELMKELRNTE